MKKEFRVNLFFPAVLAGLLLMSVALASPKLVFVDAGFDYYGHEVAYLSFSRDVASDVLTVTVNETETPGSLAFYIPQLEPDLMGDALYYQLGIDVSTRSLELAFPAESYLDLLNYFHDLAGQLGFIREQAMFSGDTYVFNCGCQLHEETHLRVSFNRGDDISYVRLVLQTPFAYRARGL